MYFLTVTFVTFHAELFIVNPLSCKHGSLLVLYSIFHCNFELLFVGMWAQKREKAGNDVLCVCFF